MTPASQSALNTQSLLPTAIKSWESYLRDQGRSPHTIKAFLSDVNLLASFVPADRTLGALTTAELNRFFTWLEKERDVPCSPKTLARRITSVKSLFRWIHQFGVLAVDPAEAVAQRSAISPLPQVLHDDEVEAVLKAADKHRHNDKSDARYYALISLLLQTGVKKSELLGIKLNHLELDPPGGGPLVFIRYASPANRYKERKLLLNEEWVKAYHEYKAQYSPEDQLFPWSPRRLEYLLEDIGKEAGLDKHLSFDMCRWTSALRDFAGGMETDRVRQKLGISKIQWREIHMKLRQLSGQE